MSWLTRRRKTTPTIYSSHPFQLFAEPATADYRGIPTLACPCGSLWMMQIVQIDPETRLPGLIMLDSMCACCGALLTTPTPIDGEETANGLS